jgi:hypothetical protein
MAIPLGIPSKSDLLQLHRPVQVGSEPEFTHQDSSRKRKQTPAHLNASLMHPRATPRPPQGHLKAIYSGVQSHPKATPRLPQGYPKATPRLPQGHPKATPRPPQGYPKATPRLPQGYPKATPRLPQGYPKATSRLPRSLGAETTCLPRTPHHPGRPIPLPKPSPGCRRLIPFQPHSVQ